jgi:xanthosine utilization system XapX-like protein
LTGEKPTVAFILSLVGGILVLRTGVWVGLIFFILGTIFPVSQSLSVFWGLLGILVGIPIIFCAVKMLRETAIPHQMERPSHLVLTG